MERLLVSAKHLAILDKTFQEYPPYKEIKQKLERVPLFEEFLKEVYAGGKKRGKHGYSRQMILGDLLQYILTGRGYYFAVRGDDYMRSFIKIIMYISNLWILMEDISVDAELRNRILESLEQEIGCQLFETDEDKRLFNDLKQYEGRIVKDEGKGYEDVLDSLLPKRVGGASELLVYAYLIRKKYGYVVPLLQAQRLLGNQGKYIIPPDFLLLRSKGETFGIEVGVGKERQIASFSTVTSIPVFTVTVGSFEQPQPYRCGKCLKWIIYCDKVIEICANNQDGDRKYLECEECPLFNDGKCPFIVYHGPAHDYEGEERKLRYHYSCVKDDPLVKKELASSRSRKPKLIAPIPWVSGLEHIKEE